MYMKGTRQTFRQMNRVWVYENLMTAELILAWLEPTFSECAIWKRGEKALRQG